MSLAASSNDSFLKLAENLRELEVVTGDKARPAIAEVGEQLMQAIASRARGEMPRALEHIRRAMKGLAALDADLDPAEGSIMREIARIFMQSLSFGEKDAATDVANVRHPKAGDPKYGDRGD